VDFLVIDLKQSQQMSCGLLVLWDHTADVNFPTEAIKECATYWIENHCSPHGNDKSLQITIMHLTDLCREIAESAKAYFDKTIMGEFVDDVNIFKIYFKTTIR
jgi:hypothetical protein